ncbi:hypothetical protein FHG87_025184, partial [Trinorchestia longiramus]
QHVNEPTRRSNIIDLVMTTPDTRIIELEFTDKIGDHHMIDLALEVLDPNTNTQQKHVFYHKRTNFELMKEKLGSNDYELLMNKNAEEYYMILKEIVATATEHSLYPQKATEAKQ